MRVHGLLPAAREVSCPRVCAEPEAASQCRACPRPTWKPPQHEVGIHLFRCSHRCPPCTRVQLFGTPLPLPPVSTLTGPRGPAVGAPWSLLLPHRTKPRAKQSSGCASRPGVRQWRGESQACWDRADGTVSRLSEPHAPSPGNRAVNSSHLRARSQEGSMCKAHWEAGRSRS